MLCVNLYSYISIVSLYLYIYISLKDWKYNILSNVLVLARMLICGLKLSQDAPRTYFQFQDSGLDFLMP